ncbi:hypothetical protein [Pantoea ananatis]|uniref:hypothetical protein n=1 Tax=Pantoea ananas TaxID=553 RepID=UPI000B7DDB2B|nr:hypothetical protein [Pantoea ananatis]
MRDLDKADIQEALTNNGVKVDDGRDYSQRIVWQMNQKRHMRNGVVAPKPEAPQVAPASIQKKRKPRKRSYSVVQKAIGAV